MKSISEGVKRKSLEHLIQPTLSIDEYESKISDKRVIVVGFYCGDKDPANDLSMFIDSSSLPILDTEVSPAPTPQGYYVVWVEIARNKMFPKILQDMLTEVDNLTNVDEWKFQSPAHQEAVSVDETNLKKFLVLDPAEIVDPPEEEPAEEPAEEPEEEPAEEPAEEPETENKETENLAEFWVSALVDKVSLSEDILTLHKGSLSQSFSIQESLPDAIDFLSETQDTRRLKSWLGPAYNVYLAPQGFIIESSNCACYITVIDNVV